MLGLPTWPTQKQKALAGLVSIPRCPGLPNMPWSVSQWTWPSLSRIIKGGEELREFSTALWLDGFFYMEITSRQGAVFQHSQRWASGHLLYDLMHQSQPLCIILGYFQFFSSSGQEKAEEGDRSWAVLKKDVLLEREQLLELPLTALPALCHSSCLTTVLFVAHEHHDNAKGREKGAFTPRANISRGEHCSW